MNLPHETDLAAQGNAFWLCDFLTTLAYYPTRPGNECPGPSDGLGMGTGRRKIPGNSREGGSKRSARKRNLRKVHQTVT